MDKYLDKLDQLVFKEKYTIRPVHLVDLFNLHIKQAQFLLEQFNEKHQDLIVKYGLLGHQSELTDEIGARRYVEVEKDEVENEKKKFTKLISCTIKSVKDKDSKFDRQFDTGILNLQTTKDDLMNYQRKGFHINENVNFREEQLDPLFSRLNIKRSDLNKPKDSISKQINTNDKPAAVKEEQQKSTKIIKPEAKPNDLFSSFKKAASIKAKDEPAAIKDENKEPEKNDKMDSDGESTAMNDVEMKEDDEPMIKSSQKEKNKKSNASDDDESVSKSNGQVKRSSKQIDSDSDEDFSKENVKHKKKKQRKRIAKVFEDSSSDEEQQMRKIAKALESDSGEDENNEEKSTYRPPKEEVSSKLVEEEERYIDEDGYELTRTVKKIVKEEPAIKNEKIVNDTTNTKNLNDKAKESKPKKTDKESNLPDKKPAAKAKPQPKNQTSIMSFFKPKNQAK